MAITRNQGDEQMNSKASALRASAAQHEKDAADSFDRCDTDGFVSQACSGLNAQLDRAKADIAEADGQWTFERTVLVEIASGKVVTDARVVRTRYGMKYRIDRTDEWLPYHPARESTLAKKGYREAHEEAVAPAKAIHWSPSNAKGFSGLGSVQTIIIRTDATKADGWHPVGPPAGSDVAKRHQAEAVNRAEAEAYAEVEHAERQRREAYERKLVYRSHADIDALTLDEAREALDSISKQHFTMDYMDEFARATTEQRLLKERVAELEGQA